MLNQDNSRRESPAPTPSQGQLANNALDVSAFQEKPAEVKNERGLEKSNEPYTVVSVKTREEDSKAVEPAHGGRPFFGSSTSSYVLAGLWATGAALHFIGGNFLVGALFTACAVGNFFIGRGRARNE